MLRRALARLAARFGGEEVADGEETARTRFVPSRLDASVRFAHGDSGADVERELADIESNARALEEHRRDK